MPGAAELSDDIATEVARRIANPWAVPVKQRPERVPAQGAVRAVGVDVVDVARLGLLLTERGDRLADRLLTPLERALCAGTSEGYRLNCVAGRVAAKEAVRKTLTRHGAGVGWHDVEVDRESGGEPLPLLTGRALEAFGAAGLTGLHLSITHDADVAVAVALAT
ncbi:holo-ACP synthase [Streptomyces xiaopingdaonensis]|uniref:holo-ACP synthase n=1 Tax=Streptomyces xiaopingdaonensis TaxID=1565415 RepID=UPI0002EBBF11|nr:holo-ACP synthase [Streptomyces xiaopingdaonensis]